MNKKELAEQILEKHLGKEILTSSGWLYCDNDWKESLIAAMTEAMSDSKAEAIVKDLAGWSRKYPRGRIYGYSGKENMDGQLIALEERAKQWLDETPQLLNNEQNPEVSDTTDDAQRYTAD